MTHAELIELALSSDLCSILSENIDHRPMPLRSASAFQYLVLEYRRCDRIPAIKEKIKENLVSITTSGKEPSFNLGINWHYPMIVNSIALVKDTDIWGELEEDTKNRLTCLMKCFAYMLHYAHDKDNHYETGLGRNTHFGKKWAPNITASTIGYALPLAHFFGGNQAMVDLYTSFDYESFIAELNEYGFTKALATFSTPAIDTEYGFQIPSAKEILEGSATEQYVVETRNGLTNISYGGYGAGIKRKFFCDSFSPFPIGITDPTLFTRLITIVYMLPVKSSITFGNYIAKIADDTVSPEEGKKGMFFEFNHKWRSGRSWPQHAMIDFAIMNSCLSTIEELGLFNLDNTVNAKNLMATGNNDLIYKLEHGYNGYNDRPMETIYESNYAGYYFWKDIWQNR